MFFDRQQAGEQLAARLGGLELKDPLVLAIPRGGVVIGAVLARRLHAELDVVLSRKLRAPQQPELAVGALGEDGQVYLDPRAGEIPGLTETYLGLEQRYQAEEIARRKKLFREVRPAACMAGRSVIVTDDGLATGSTMIAALKIVSTQHPHELIVAVPVAPLERLEYVDTLCDQRICLHAPREFWAIGQFYDHFEQVDETRALELLRALSPNPPKTVGDSS